MFSEVLKELRESRKLTQSDLAKELGLKRQSISNYENNGRQPDFDILNKIADYFDVTTDYLTGRTNFKQPGMKSYFTQEEKVIIQNSSPMDAKIMENFIIREIDYYKEHMLSLLDSNHYNLKNIEIFAKNIHYLHGIHRNLKQETDSFVKSLNSKDLDSKHILSSIYTRFSELTIPQYDFNTNLSCLVENLYLLKEELINSVLKISISLLLKRIENSSEDINNSLLEKIREVYGLDIEGLMDDD